MDPTIPEPPESPRLLRPRTVGEILTDAFELYRRHWQNLFVIVAVIVIPLSFLQVLVGQVWIHEGLTEEELRNGVEVTVNGAFVAGVFASLVVAMASILMWTVVTGAIGSGLTARLTPTPTLTPSQSTWTRRRSAELPFT